MNQSRRYVEYDEVREGIIRLGQRILNSADGWSPDLIVGVSRGGLVPATHLSYLLERPLLFISDGVLLGSVGSHRRLLVVDEINDSGDSLRRIREDTFGGPLYRELDVRYAALYTRATSNFLADYFLDYPPYFIADASYQHFPWEKPGNGRGAA